MPEPLTWSDAELDAALDAFRAPTAEPDLSALRDRIVGDAHRAQVRSQPRGTLVTVDEPDRAPASRRPALGTAAAVLAVVAVAGAVAVVVPAPGLTPTAPPEPEYTEWTRLAPEPPYSDWEIWSPGPSVRLAPAGDRPLLPTAELMAGASDPVVGPGQYLYQRFDRGDGEVDELWVPADRSAEWLLRDDVEGVVTELRAPRGEFWPPVLPGDDSWPFPGGRSLAEQDPDPRALYDLLALSVGERTTPHIRALASAAEILTRAAPPAERRALVVAALGYLPGARLERDGDTARIIADAEGSRARAELWIDVPTGRVVRTALEDDTGLYLTDIGTAVVDEIGERPG